MLLEWLISLFLERNIFHMYFKIDFLSVPSYSGGEIHNFTRHWQETSFDSTRDF